MLRQLGRRCSQAARSAAASSSRAPSQTRCASSAASEAATAPVYTVFGASGGIGSALSKRLATHPGASVVLVGRDAAKLDHLKNQLVNPGSHAGIAESRTACIVADVTDSKQVSGVVCTAGDDVASGTRSGSMRALRASHAPTRHSMPVTCSWQ